MRDLREFSEDGPWADEEDAVRKDEARVAAVLYPRARLIDVAPINPPIRGDEKR